MRSVELELDDCTYIMDYTYERPRADSFYEPGIPRGYVHVEQLTLILDGYEGRPVEIDVTRYRDELKVVDDLRELAYENEREVA